MKEPKLYYLLKNLSKEEFKRLRKAVFSPLFTTNPKVRGLFENLRSQYPNFKNSESSRIKLHSNLFPNRPFNDQKLRRVFSDLTKVVQQFYVFLELEKREFTKEKILIEAYGNRNMFPLFERKTTELIEVLDNESVQNSDYFLLKMNLLKGLYFNVQHDKYNKKDDTVEALSNSLDGFFSLSKMQIAIALKNQMKILNKNYHIRFLEAVESERETGFLEQNALFQLYGLAVMLVEKPSQMVFDEFEKMLFQYIECLNEEDQRILFYNGLNFAVRHSNKGLKQYNKIAFEWLKFGLEKQFLFQNNQLSAATFGNIVVFGSKAGALKWVNSFIDQYSCFLMEEIREDETNYSKVLVNLYLKEYDKVISKITNYSFSDLYKLRTRTLLVRTYFELFLENKSYFFVLIHTIDAFENYLYRNDRFKKEKLESYHNLIRILKGLLTRMIKQEDANDVKLWLKKRLEGHSNISSKKWLEERFQLNEL